MNECVVCITTLPSDVYHPSANSDYRHFSSSIRFPARVNEITFSVCIYDDNRVENTEEFYIDLDIPSSFAYNSVIKDPDSPATTTVTITDGSCKSCCLTYCTAATIWFVYYMCMCHRNSVVCLVGMYLRDRVSMLHCLNQLATGEVR